MSAVRQRPVLSSRRRPKTGCYCKTLSTTRSGDKCCRANGAPASATDVLKDDKRVSSGLSSVERDTFGLKGPFATSPTSPVLSPETQSVIDNAERMIQDAKRQIKAAATTPTTGARRTRVCTCSNDPPLDDETDELLYIRELVATKFQETDVDAEELDGKTCSHQQRTKLQQIESTGTHCHHRQLDLLTRQKCIIGQQLNSLSNRAVVARGSDGPKANGPIENTKNNRVSKIDAFRIQTGPAVSIERELQTWNMKNVQISPDPSFVQEQNNVGNYEFHYESRAIRRTDVTTVEKKDSSTSPSTRAKSGYREKRARIFSEDDVAVSGYTIRERGNEDNKKLTHITEIDTEGKDSLSPDTKELEISEDNVQCKEQGDENGQNSEKETKNCEDPAEKDLAVSDCVNGQNSSKLSVTEGPKVSQSGQIGLVIASKSESTGSKPLNVDEVDTYPGKIVHEARETSNETCEAVEDVKKENGTRLSIGDKSESLSRQPRTSQVKEFGVQVNVSGIKEDEKRRENLERDRYYKAVEQQFEHILRKYDIQRQKKCNYNDDIMNIDSSENSRKSNLDSVDLEPPTFGEFDSVLSVYDRVIDRVARETEKITECLTQPEFAKYYSRTKKNRKNELLAFRRDAESTGVLFPVVRAEIQTKNSIINPHESMCTHDEYQIFAKRKYTDDRLYDIDDESYKTESNDRRNSVQIAQTGPRLKTNLGNVLNISPRIQHSLKERSTDQFGYPQRDSNVFCKQEADPSYRLKKNSDKQDQKDLLSMEDDLITNEKNSQLCSKDTDRLNNKNTDDLPSILGPFVINLNTIDRMMKYLLQDENKCVDHKTVGALKEASVTSAAVKNFLVTLQNSVSNPKEYCQDSIDKSCAKNSDELDRDRVHILQGQSKVNLQQPGECNEKGIADSSKSVGDRCNYQVTGESMRSDGTPRQTKSCNRCNSPKITSDCGSLNLIFEVQNSDLHDAHQCESNCKEHNLPIIITEVEDKKPELSPKEVCSSTLHGVEKFITLPNDKRSVIESSKICSDDTVLTPVLSEIVILETEKREKQEIQKKQEIQEIHVVKYNQNTTAHCKDLPQLIPTIVASKASDSDLQDLRKDEQTVTSSANSLKDCSSLQSSEQVVDQAHDIRTSLIVQNNASGSSETSKVSRMDPHSSQKRKESISSSVDSTKHCALQTSESLSKRNKFDSNVTVHESEGISQNPQKILSTHSDESLHLEKTSLTPNASRSNLGNLKTQSSGRPEDAFSDKLIEEGAYDEEQTFRADSAKHKIKMSSTHVNINDGGTSAETSRSEGEIYLPSSSSYSLGEIRVPRCRSSENQTMDRIGESFLITEAILNSLNESTNSLTASFGEIRVKSEDE